MAASSSSISMVSSSHNEANRVFHLFQCSKCNVGTVRRKNAKANVSTLLCSACSKCKEEGCMLKAVSNCKHGFCRECAPGNKKRKVSSSSGEEHELSVSKEPERDERYELDMEDLQDLIDQGFSADALGGVAEQCELAEIDVSQMWTTAEAVEKVLTDFEMTDKIKYGEVQRNASCFVENPAALEAMGFAVADAASRADFFREAVALAENCETI